MLDTLVLVTSPRTGANHLLSLAGNFREVHPLPNLFRPLTERLDPGAALTRAIAEAEALEKRVVAFKLRHDMVATEAVERELLDRPGVRLVLLMRRQIDAYLSWCKAIEFDAWQDRDTTGLTVEAEIDDFLAFMDTQERWFDHWRNWLNRRFLPAPVLRYETDVELPPEGTLKRFAAAAAQVGITLRVPATLAIPGLTRQDRVKAPAERVSNWPQFSRLLVERGLEKRAFGYPA